MDTSKLTLPNIAYSTALALGLLGTTMGIRGILTPASFAASFGLPPSSAPKIGAADADNANPFIPLLGARNLASGLTILALGYVGDRRAVGITVLVGGVTAATDVLVVWRYGKKETAYGHVGTTALSAILGGFLVYDRS